MSDARLKNEETQALVYDQFYLASEFNYKLYLENYNAHDLDFKLDTEAHKKKTDRAAQIIKELQNADSFEAYDKLYKEWEEHESALKEIGCIAPLPPIPKEVLPKPISVNICHESYLLGYSIGESIGELVFTVQGSEGDLKLQEHCLNQYSAWKRLKGNVSNSTLESMCFDKGKEESTKLQRQLIGNPHKYKQYLATKAKYTHDIIDNELGREKYYTDLLLHIAK